MAINLGPTELLLVVLVVGGPALVILGVALLVVRATRRPQGHHQVKPITTCPDCMGMVSTIAKACPHCGRPGGIREAQPRKALWWLGTLPAWIGGTVLTMYLLPAQYAPLLALSAVGLFAWTVVRPGRGRRPKPTFH